MPKITCPNCGQRGSSDVLSSEFEVHGQWQGWPVRKCMACGVGVLVKPGLLGAKTTLLDPALWDEMEATYERWQAEEEEQLERRIAEDEEGRQAMRSPIAQLDELAKVKALQSSLVEITGVRLTEPQALGLYRHREGAREVSERSYGSAVAELAGVRECRRPKGAIDAAITMGNGSVLVWRIDAEGWLIEDGRRTVWLASPTSTADAISSL